MHEIEKKLFLLEQFAVASPLWEGRYASISNFCRKRLCHTGNRRVGLLQVACYD
jgi:hypothetical protein